MLRVNKLTYRYKHHGSQDTYEYNLTVQKGEIVGILGESGSGKSTLLDLISGFLESDSGEIMVEGTEITSLDPEKRPVTILFQSNNLFEHLTSIENVLIGLRGSTKGDEQETDKARRLLERMGISEQENKIVSQLSGGQQQRVALARVLLRDKPVLLLDEPFTGLDSDTRVEILHLVRSITTEKSLYTIMVTHQRFDCDEIADKTYNISNGTLG